MQGWPAEWTLHSKPELTPICSSSGQVEELFDALRAVMVGSRYRCPFAVKLPTRLR